MFLNIKKKFPTGLRHMEAAAVRQSFKMHFLWSLWFQGTKTSSPNGSSLSSEGKPVQGSG